MYEVETSSLIFARDERGVGRRRRRSRPESALVAAVRAGDRDAFDTALRALLAARARRAACARPLRRGLRPRSGRFPRRLPKARFPARRFALRPVGGDDRAQPRDRLSPPVARDRRVARGGLARRERRGRGERKRSEIIRSLPEAYRETLVLRLVEGMTGPEIAERTGLQPASVRVNLHRGMKLLREKARGERAGSYERLSLGQVGRAGGRR